MRLRRALVSHLVLLLGATASIAQLTPTITREWRRIGNTAPVMSVAISPDGNTIVSGSEDRSIGVWGLHDGLLRRTLAGHTGSVSSVAISPDGKTIVSGSMDGTIKLWDLADGAPLRTLTADLFVIGVAVSPDGSTIISGSYDNTIKVWNLADGALLRTLPVPVYRLAT